MERIRQDFHRERRFSVVSVVKRRNSTFFSVLLDDHPIDDYCYAKFVSRIGSRAMLSRRSSTLLATGRTKNRSGHLSQGKIMFQRWVSYQQPTWLIGLLFLVGFALDVQRVMTPVESRQSGRRDSNLRAPQEEHPAESGDICETH